MAKIDINGDKIEPLERLIVKSIKNRFRVEIETFKRILVIEFGKN